MTSVRARAAAVVDAPACALGESPRWGHGAWWWVDAEVGDLWTADASLSVVRRVLATGGRLSLAHPADHGRLVVADGADLVVVDPATGDRIPWTSVDVPAGWLLNDGTADGAGRLWVGTVHPDRRAGAGVLHVVERDGGVRVAAEGLTLSNGMAWAAPDRLLHADSLEGHVLEHDVDPRRGEVRGSRPVLALGTGPLALPDGMASDLEGGLWVAMYGTGQVWRVLDGQVVAVVEVPTPRVTSVALGGPDGRDLLLTTAQEGMDATALAADPWAGRLFRARAEVSGATVPVVAPLLPDM